MVVDDEKGILKSLSALLSNEYKVITARSGREALGIISMLEHPENIALIICDQRMPEMSGLQLLEEIKNKIPNTLRMILTAYNDKDVMIEAINEVNIYQFILKPFEPEELLLRVRRAIETFEHKRKLDEYHKNLERKVEERTKELEIRNKQLEKLNSEKDKFYHIVGHDLQALMEKLVNDSTLLYKTYGSISKDEEWISLNKIYNSIYDISGFLENLLYWTRFQLGRIECKLVKIDMKILVARVIEIFKDKANRKRIKIYSEIKTGTFALGDKYMIFIVLKNFISNALKFTNPGGSVKISATINDEWVEISITDNGIGMTKEEIENLFIIGKQIIKKGTAGENGGGLGLLLSKIFVEQNIGSIMIASEPGAGASFKFKLPLCE